MCSPYFILQHRIGDITRAEDLNFSCFKPEVARSYVRKEFIAGCDSTGIVFPQIVLTLFIRLRRQESIAAGPLTRPRNSPLHWPNHAVIVNRRKPRFPVIHPAGVERGH